MFHWLFNEGENDQDDIASSLASVRGHTPPMYKNLLKPAMALLNQEEQSEEEFLGAQLILMANGLI